MKDSGEGDETAWETPPTSTRVPREGGRGETKGRRKVPAGTVGQVRSDKADGGVPEPKSHVEGVLPLPSGRPPGFPCPLTCGWSGQGHTAWAQRGLQGQAAGTWVTLPLQVGGPRGCPCPPRAGGTGDTVAQDPLLPSPLDSPQPHLHLASLG